VSTDLPESPYRNETATERHDRNLAELLQEVRVAIPGVQVLFAFLLTVPFSATFARTTPFQRGLYLATLLCSAAASALLIAPMAYHRFRFRRRDKHNVVEVSNRLAIAGLSLLGVAITGAVWLVTDVLFGPTTTALASIGIALLIVVVWYGLPLRRARRRDGGRPGESETRTAPR
jgi:hypothetical protein